MLKVLFHAAAPLAVFAHPDIIVEAPYELTTSGLGDVLAKSVSSADWKLNKLLFDDYYCQFSVDLLKDLEPIYLNNPGAIKNKERHGFEALFKALFYSSISMTITGTSAPASGGEHLISHTLDIVAERDHMRHDLHGRQVGVGSVLMAAHSYRDIRRDGQPLERAYFENIVNMAHQMRSRFTVLDLATLLGVVPEKTPALVDHWVG